jgi:ATP-dependent Clp protease ATP-binding subunit ClpB
MKVFLDPSKTGPQAMFLDVNLRRMVVGQEDAVRRIVSTYQMYLIGLNAPSRPVGSFLFLGPTGSGKTRIVEATAEILFNNSRTMIKIDCGEFQHSHEIAKLVGSPPGYLGHRETHPMLSQEALSQHQTPNLKLSLVLFDEIEKASDALWNLLLGILDRAILTLGSNQKVDFSRTLIFMTSNLGARQIGAVASRGIGFTNDRSSEPESSATDRASRVSIEAARRNFTPEFMNRIDHLVTFSTLERGQLEEILDIELHFLQQRIFGTRRSSGFIFTLSPAAKSFVLEHGTDARYGARHLKRSIERLVVHPMSNLIATEQLRFGDWLYIDRNSTIQQELSFTKIAENLRSREMAERLEFSLTNPSMPPWNPPMWQAG